MQVGIAGLAGAGKTTIFNAIARSHAQVGAFNSAQAEPNRAVVKVPDDRVDALADLFKPKSVKHADVQLVDVAGLARGAGKESASAVLGHLRTVDALLLVVDGFSQSSSVASAQSDLASLETELLLADMDVVDRRLDRLDREVRMTRGSDVERQAKARELELLRRLHEALSKEEPVRSVALSAGDEWLLRGYALLTAKPALAILNTGDDAGEGAVLAQELNHAGDPSLVSWLSVPGRLEMELAELSPDDAREFMQALGITELVAGRVIEASYDLLDLISFLTAGEDEVRAWTLRRASTALDAAGSIHSDLARGFIRAEVVTFDDLMDAKGFVEARRRGKLRSEGKGYVVQDGDVINVLFNV